MPSLPHTAWDGDILQHAGLALRDVLALHKSTTLPLAASHVRHEVQKSALDLNNFNASAIMLPSQENQIQVIATTFSSVSILAAICAMYWFLMMRRNFRRDLVLMLICGDFWKAAWFLVFASLSLSNGDIPTTSSFCQASGYLLQAGIEACDIAIFLMSLHMHLQIFPPKNSFLGHDGLSRIRHWVVGAWFIVPSVLASLAFINERGAYVSQGGFCTLPIRPFWYRLALSWIPRYLICIYIMYVAISIYRHVGYEFKVFGEVRDGSSSFNQASSIATRTATNHKVTSPQVSTARTQSTLSDAAIAEKHAGDEGIAPDDDFAATTPSALPWRTASSESRPNHNTRRQSVPNWAGSFGAAGPEHTTLITRPTAPRSKSNPSSRRESRTIAENIATEDFAPQPPPFNFERARGSVSTVATVRSSGAHSSYEQRQPSLDTITEHRTSASTGTSIPGNAASKAMKQRRRVIQRQLRLLFIYPVVYTCLWILPFVNHCLNYSNHFAQHPIFALNALNIFCQNIMGLCDVVIFCWRERPWRHIPGSDGTFFGSFCFWRFAFDGQSAAERRTSSPMEKSSVEKQASKKSHSGLLASWKSWWSRSMAGKTPAAGANSKHSPHSSNRASISAAPMTPSRRAPPIPMHRRTHSGGGELRMMEAERAHERLQMERADWNLHRTSLNERRTSVMSANLVREQQQQQPDSPPPPQRKEWWDRQMSVMDDF
ncbi:G -coupled receptor [Lecanosticta acicola]|uniref:G -coupled receptor n=1 Tax=Lecanosticta acicola TaxID=111012 RepID=A0AAI8Z0T6_9PEZI|nr:G -coupled receptor [Lecanosticta acicola]